VSGSAPPPGGPETRAGHWDATYAERGAEDVSWFQSEPHTSLALFDAVGVHRDAAVVDVGGGASALVDRLVARGYVDLTVLDISPVALDLARDRVGDAAKVEWVASDVLTWGPDRHYDLWHDRAVFHFLTDPRDRAAYLATLTAAVPTGAVILATFAPDGPDSCSGLPVARYGPDELADLLAGFDVVEARRDVHVTPWGAEQPFTFVAARRAAAT
jgi:SAM-dependent methyltransferase